MTIKSPTTAQIAAARAAAGHTQAQAAAEVYMRTDRRWRDWEGGKHRMPPAAFELYLYKTQAVIIDVPEMLAAWRKG